MTESDGINEIYEELVHHGVSTGARVLEVVQQHRAQRLQLQAIADEQDARRHLAQLQVERSIAVVKLESVDDDRWWSEASDEQVGELWQIADTWRGHDPQLAVRGERLREQTISRRGYDPAERFAGVGKIGNQPSPGSELGDLARVTQAKPAAESVARAPRGGQRPRRRGRGPQVAGQQRDRGR